MPNTEELIQDHARTVDRPDYAETEREAEMAWRVAWKVDGKYFRDSRQFERRRFAEDYAKAALMASVAEGFCVYFK